MTRQHECGMNTATCANGKCQQSGVCLEARRLEIERLGVQLPTPQEPPAND